MVNPVEFTDYNRSDVQLEEMALFSILVAGKNALTTARSLDKLLNLTHKNLSDFQPFTSLRPFSTSRLETMLYDCGIGCYVTKAKGVHQLVHAGLDLRTCTVDELEKIHSIGFKTSRMFVLHSRHDANVACLDVHILKYMNDRGYNVPSATPSSKKKYKEIEEQFLTLARASGLTVAAFDLAIWNKYRKKRVA